jgi:hypothetical protein
MIGSLLWIPGIRWLVLWSYAPSAHLGFGSAILGKLFDPDLTEVGEGAIVGSGVSVVAHSLTRNPDGTRLLTNLSLRRRSEAELRNLSSDYSIFVVEVSDRLGDYGLVGLCILHGLSAPTERTGIDSLLISCRALGRRVGDAVLHGIVELVHLSGKSRIEAEFVPGPRNQPIIDFLLRAGFVPSGQGRYALNASTPIDLPRSILWVGPTAG